MQPALAEKTFAIQRTVKDSRLPKLKLHRSAPTGAFWKGIMVFFRKEKGRNLNSVFGCLLNTHKVSTSLLNIILI